MVPLYEATTPTTSANHKDNQACFYAFYCSSKRSSPWVRRRPQSSVRTIELSVELARAIYRVPCTGGTGISLQPHVT